MDDRPISKRRRSSAHSVTAGLLLTSDDLELTGTGRGSDYPSRTDPDIKDVGSDENAVDEEGYERRSGTRRRTLNSGLGRGEIVTASTADGGVPPTGSKAAQISEEEKKRIVTSSMVKSMGINGLLICLWYSFSISISVYNKWMFSKENLNFPFPLFTTSVHMLVQFSLASSILYFIPHLRPGADAKLSGNTEYTQLNNSAEEAEAQDEAGPDAAKPQKQQPLMTKTFYFTRIAPCGTATALDIGLGNFSLRYISLTFFTMCKSSVLAFVLIFAFLFRLESPTWRLCMIIVVMTAGVVMMVAGEAAFDAAGFGLVMSASLCSGFRWSLTQILLLRNRATNNPFSATFFLTPVMFVALFVLAVPIEGPSNVIAALSDLAASEGGFLSIGILLFPGFLAFLMVSAEFALLKRSSVVTLSVCGIFKEVLTISAAGAIFGDELTPINVSGLIVTIASIAAYNWLKYTTMREKTEEAVHETMDAEPGSLVRKSTDNGFAERADARRSTDALMRDSMGAMGTAGRDSKAFEVSHSPNKRPEDFE